MEHDRLYPSALRSGPFLRSSASSIRQDLGLTQTEFGLLVGTPILTGIADPA
jgi:hypothetical protein